jgi:hypothetical protein
MIRKTKYRLGALERDGKNIRSSGLYRYQSKKIPKAPKVLKIELTESMESVRAPKPQTLSNPTEADYIPPPPPPPPLSSFPAMLSGPASVEETRQMLEEILKEDEVKDEIVNDYINSLVRKAEEHLLDVTTFCQVVEEEAEAFGNTSGSNPEVSQWNSRRSSSGTIDSVVSETRSVQSARSLSPSVKPKPVQAKDRVTALIAEPDSICLKSKPDVLDLTSSTISYSGSDQACQSVASDDAVPYAASEEDLTADVSIDHRDTPMIEKDLVSTAVIPPPSPSTLSILMSSPESFSFSPRFTGDLHEIPPPPPLRSQESLDAQPLETLPKRMLQRISSNDLSDPKVFKGHQEKVSELAVRFEVSGAPTSPMASPGRRQSLTPTIDVASRAAKFSGSPIMRMKPFPKPIMKSPARPPQELEESKESKPIKVLPAPVKTQAKNLKKQGSNSTAELEHLVLSRPKISGQRRSSTIAMTKFSPKPSRS